MLAVTKSENFFLKFSSMKNSDFFFLNKKDILHSIALKRQAYLDLCEYFPRYLFEMANLRLCSQFSDVIEK